LRNGTPVYIIDGYNVILSGGYKNRTGGRKKSRGSGPSAPTEVEAARNRFIAFLGTYVTRKRVDITVVWDGSNTGLPGNETRNGVRSVFSSRGTADDAIIRMVERAKNRRRITVVSDDRKHIISVVRNLGAGTMGTGRFLNLLEGGGGRDGRGGAAAAAAAAGDAGDEKGAAADISVDEWMELFRAR